LDTQVVALGECSFGGVNGHKIGKFHFGWKVDIQGFPTSQLELNFDAGKCPKNRWKGALRVGLRHATHQDFLHILHLPAQEFAQL